MPYSTLVVFESLLEFNLRLTIFIEFVLSKDIYIKVWLKSFSLIATYQIITLPCQTLHSCKFILLQSVYILSAFYWASIVRPQI